MNAEQLHAIAVAVKADLEAADSVSAVRQLSEALRNAVNDPAEPSYQQQVSDVFQELEERLPDSDSNDFAPTWVDVIAELEIDHLLGRALLDRIRDEITQNQVTVSIAAERIGELSEELGELESGLDYLISGLEYFDIETEDVAPGRAEVGVIIPRAAVDNELGKLGSELSEIERIIGPFMELATGSRQPISVSSVASSEFGLFVEMMPETAALIAVATDRVITAYKRILEVRKLRQEMADQGVTDDQLDGVDDFANNHMATAVDDAVEVTIRHREGRAVDLQGYRENELRVGLRWSLNAIANRIDRGYNIDVRAGVPAEDDSEDASANADTNTSLQIIRETSANLQFISRVGRPILELPEGDAGEDREQAESP